MTSVNKFNHTEIRLWGEISEESRNKVSDDLLRTLIRGAVKQEGPKKLPVNEDEIEFNVTLPEYLTKPNEYVIHTIKLNEHAKAVQALIESIVPKKTEFKTCPPIPDMSKDASSAHNREKDLKKPLGYKFELGQGPELPVLDNDNVNLMLQKAVLVSLAETGFDKAKRSAVYVLIDVVRDILTKVSKMLHMFSQHDVMRDRTIYKDPLEKVLQLLGLSGVRELQQYYTKNVIGKRDLALKRSNNLVNQYNSVVNKLKEQAAIEADEANTPDMNISSMNLNDNTIQTTKEPGFQTLLDLKTDSKPSNISAQEIILNGSSTKTIIKKRISSNILQVRRKKMKSDALQ